MPRKKTAAAATTTALRQIRLGDERIADLTKAARVWLLCETLGEKADRDHVVAAAKALGVRERTARNHFNTWRYARTQAHRAALMPMADRRRIIALTRTAA